MWNQSRGTYGYRANLIKLHAGYDDMVHGNEHTTRLGLRTFTYLRPMFAWTEESSSSKRARFVGMYNNNIIPSSPQATVAVPARPRPSPILMPIAAYIIII